MGVDSKIQWCHHTFNPWWGCTRVSPGCEHCYAETFAKRTGHKVWGAKADRRFFGAKHWAEPLKWNTAAANKGERHRVFCASMADVFEDREDLVEQRNQLWDLILSTPHLDWLLLTKRPENLARMLPWGRAGMFAEPFKNVWLGTTVEDQRRADERIPHLVRVPAAVRFLSCEPLLGAITFRPRAESTADMLRLMDEGIADKPAMLDGIDWCIVGGESGPGSRPFTFGWARSIMDQCRAGGVPVFVKQAGSNLVEARCDGDGFDGLERIRLVDRKGGDPSEWPADLRVRDFPVQP